MTFRNYRTVLQKQMMNYLRFMKHTDTDEQLLTLNAEVTELRGKIHFLDQLTASQMMQEIIFETEIYESDGFSGFEIKKSISGSRMANMKVSRKHTLSSVKPRESKYNGVCFSPSAGRWQAIVNYNNKRYLNGKYITEEEAIKQRDLCIIKHKLPLIIQFLSPPK